jgi:all-trans-retinol 13,14-reductase
VVVISPACRHWYEQWAHLSPTERRKDLGYQEWKHRFGQRLLQEGLLRHWGQDLAAAVAHTSVATPLSVEHYLASAKGAVYGLAPTQDRWLHPGLAPTHPSGLYLTGQDIITPGLAGALSSAELTANVIAGYGTVTDILTGRDLVGDLKGSVGGAV